MAKSTPNTHRRKPRPEPRTIADLYRDESQDPSPHHRKIDSHFKKLPKTTQAMLRERAAGKTLDEIAEKRGITRGTVGGTIKRAITRIRKAIAGAPRYWITGRGTFAATEAEAAKRMSASEAKTAIPLREYDARRRKAKPGN